MCLLLRQFMLYFKTLRRQESMIYFISIDDYAKVAGQGRSDFM